MGVPTAIAHRIVPQEMNVLINPAHPEAAQLRAVKRRKWLYDARLGRG